MLNALSEYFGNGKLPFLAMLRLYGHAHIILFQCLPGKSALNEVLNVILIEEDPGSMPMGPGGLGSKIADEDFDYGDEDLASPKPSPSGAIAPSKAFIKSSEGTPVATMMKRRVVQVSSASHAMYRSTLCFIYTW